jgi:hypothetical protein
MLQATEYLRSRTWLASELSQSWENPLRISSASHSKVEAQGLLFLSLRRYHEAQRGAMPGRSRTPTPRSCVAFMTAACGKAESWKGLIPSSGSYAKGSTTPPRFACSSEPKRGLSWVRYEAARAIIDQRGLLAVHLNNIRHYQTGATEPLGFNPVAMLAVGKVQAVPYHPPSYYMFERIFSAGQWIWTRYSDHTDPVKLPSWLPDPGPNYLIPLAGHAAEYNYISAEAHKNIGAWIDAAAQRVGR